MLSVWMRARDAYEGTDALAARPRYYLPKHKKEQPDDYKYRVAHAVPFNGFRAAIQGFVGLAFAKPPTLGGDVPREIRAHAENIDGRGRHLNVFAKDITEDGATVGSVGVLLDYPTRPENATAQDELNGYLRPYWIHVRAEDVLSWDHTMIGAREMLTQLVLQETATVKVGRFGRKTVTRYRVYTQDVANLGITAPVLFSVLEARKSKTSSGETDYIEIASGVVKTKRGNISKIPFEGALLGTPTSSMTARPWLKDLLDLMLAHYRVASDRGWLMHQSCVPIPVRKGYKAPVDRDGNPRPAAIAAANVLMDLPADTKEHSDIGFKFVEVAGTAFEPTAKELERMKQEMGTLGLQFLAPSSRAAETADARRIDSRIEHASLSSMMSVIDDLIERCLILHAEFMGLEIVRSGEKDGGSFSTNRDFERTALSAEMIKVYMELNLNGQLSMETLLEILERGRALPDGFDRAKEIRRLYLMQPEPSTDEAPTSKKKRKRKASNEPPSGAGGDNPPDPAGDLAQAA